MRILLFFLVMAVSYSINAQEKYDFRLLRQNDRIALADSTKRQSFYEGLKYTPILTEGHISFGGSYRGQYEIFRNEEFSFSPNEENGWYLQRILLHSDLHVNNNFRVFGEIGSSLISSKEDLSPVDQDELYVNQLFVQYKTGSISIKLGRENLELGSRRLLDPREGPNVRRAFDHLSIDFNTVDNSFRAFMGNPVVPEEGVFDNREFQNEEWLWGLYGSRLFTRKFNVDAYYLGSHYGASTYVLGTAEELRHSIGLRMWRKEGDWQYDNETIVQFGSFGSRDIFAWTVSFNLKKEINAYHHFGLKTEVISGSTSDSALGTFNPLYPRGAYFGRVARFGPANLIDLHPYWNFRFGKFMLEVDYDVFWRFSVNDAVYGPPMNIVLEGESAERFIAQQVGSIFNYEHSPHAMIELETNLIFPGDYIQEVRPGAKTLFHGVVTLELRF